MLTLMEETSLSPFLGKKVFFLYPPSVIRESVIAQLLENEYEIYFLRDDASIARLPSKYTDCIIFINIDEGRNESEWEKWVRELQDHEETARIGIGVLSYNNDEELRRKYLMNLGIQCGFIQLKLGSEPSTRILLETLKANEAKGRRKYLRAACDDDPLSSVNIAIDGSFAKGAIKDISIVGMSCVIDGNPPLPKNSLIPDMQLKLHGILLKVRGVVFGSRPEGGERVYVILFTPDTDGASKMKIRQFIQSTLQTEMEATLK